MACDISKHPCFNKDAKHKFGRIHLPVAPKCNIKCKFCNRRYDCVNESRPGVTSEVLTPREAMIYLDGMMEKNPNITVVGIAGPGDPFANPKETMQTLWNIREKYPDMLLCVASNGLNVPSYVGELARIGISHFTLTINAVEPRIGAKVYDWAREGKSVFQGEQAARKLLFRQLEALRELKKHDIVVKVNSIMIPGINDEHIEEVARTVSDLGADLFNVMPLCPVAGTDFAKLSQPDCKEVEALRAKARVFMPQMTHCQRCRADAAGLLGADNAKEVAAAMRKAREEAAQDRPYVAVATRENYFVNLHLGEATQLSIYGRREDGGYGKIEERRTPARGGGDDRWSDLSEMLRDCQAILAAGIGPSPRKALEAGGLNVVEMEGMVSEGLDHVYHGAVLKTMKREFRCGSGCAGNGLGCA